MGDIVLFKTKVPITRTDPKGAGGIGTPPNIANVPAIVVRVINAATGRLALLVFSDPPFGADARPFVPAAPMWGTWIPKP